MQLGIVHCSIGEHETAVADYRRACQAIEDMRTGRLRPIDHEKAVGTSVLHLKIPKDTFDTKIQAKYEEVFSELRSYKDQFLGEPQFVELLHDALKEYAERNGAAGNLERAVDYLVYANENDPHSERAYHDIGIALFAAGQFERYQELCQEMKTRRGEDSWCLLRVAQLRPNAPADWDELARLAEAMASEEDRQGIERHVAGIDKGIIEYRRGRYSQAIEWLDRYKNTISGDFNPVRAHLFLAMALARTGEVHEARNALGQAEAIMTKQLADERSVVEEIGYSRRWRMPLMFQILRQEAVETLANAGLD
jgi:tetratricopeptide (TPR) repeat protein